MSKSVFQQQYGDEDQSDKLSRKAKDSPFMIFGKFIEIFRHIRKNYIDKRYTLPTCILDACAIRKFLLTLTLKFNAN